jgi:hypothetical protein
MDFGRLRSESPKMRYLLLFLVLTEGAFGQTPTVGVNQTVTLTFNAVQGGPSPAPQTVQVTLNAGTTIFPAFSPLTNASPYEAVCPPYNTTIPAPSWMGTMPTSISTDPTGSATIPITVVTTGLVPGTYGVQVCFNGSNPELFSAGAANVILAVSSPSSPLPNIVNVTNAAIPALDEPPATITLPFRSMATIFGTGLADYTASSVSPWAPTLGGTEVHLAADSCSEASCDLIASLIYVSPTQINFLVPDDGESYQDLSTTSCPSATLEISPSETSWEIDCNYRVVFVRDGERIDNQSYLLGGPGRLVIASSGDTQNNPDAFQVGEGGDYDVVFEVGYDCLFSYSLTDPSGCGLSWAQGQNRAPLGAITDAASGTLISSNAPVHQGQAITLWMTGLYGGVTLNNLTGLMTSITPTPIGFGVAQLGQDEMSTLMCPGTQQNCYYGSPLLGFVGAFMTPMPIWAGESSQFVGLDQVNVAFPTCTTASLATTEKRYDAFLPYNLYGPNGPVAVVRIYLPFVVRQGDPDCQF